MSGKRLKKRTIKQKEKTRKKDPVFLLKVLLRDLKEWTPQTDPMNKMLDMFV